MTPLDITFGNALRLLGYEIETQQARPDQPIEFRLLWQALTPTKENHSIFIHTLGSEERIVAQRDAFPGRGLMSTTRLEPQATWVEAYAIPIPMTAYTPDILNLRVGVYNTTTGTRLPVSTGEALESGWTFGHIPMPLNEGQVPNPITITFGDGIGLRGYALSRLSAQAGEAIDLTLHWVCQSSIDHNYTVSVQLIDTEWRKAAQSDGWPQEGAAPTSSWVEGQALRETRTLEINKDALPGLYNLQITIYRVDDDEGTLIHLPVIQDVGEMPSQALTLTTLRVEEE
jgi:hypothetical protein